MMSGQWKGSQLFCDFSHNINALAGTLQILALPASSSSSTSYLSATINFFLSSQSTGTFVKLLAILISLNRNQYLYVQFYDNTLIYILIIIYIVLPNLFYHCHKTGLLFIFTLLAIMMTVLWFTFLFGNDDDSDCNDNGQCWREVLWCKFLIGNALMIMVTMMLTMMMTLGGALVYISY